MPPPKRAVLFDFDGVIADSWHLHRQSWQTVLDRHRISLDPTVLAAAVGWSARETAEHLVERTGLKLDAKTLADQKEEIFAEQAVDVAPMPGAVQAVKRLDADFALSIVASRRRSTVDGILNRFELGDYLNCLVTVEDLAAEQEMDNLLLLGAKKMQVDPKQCALINDARNSILAAKRVQMKAIAFASNPEHEIDYSMADAEITSLDALVPELVNQVIAA